eukprot:m.159024 g.159024  ORF g.159024 m.159024 type:complete len:146 (-) comp13363_c2_seq1:104-541(-)
MANKKVSTASKAAKAVKAGANSTRRRKIRTSVTFHRPKTLSLRRKPKYERTTAIKSGSLNEFSIIKFPVTTNSALESLESKTNALVFIVDKRANKYQIKSTVEKLYDVGVKKVNTLIRPNGQKKAFVHLTADHEAVQIASNLGFF